MTERTPPPNDYGWITVKQASAKPTTNRINLQEKNNVQIR